MNGNKVKSGVKYLKKTDDTFVTTKVDIAENSLKHFKKIHLQKINYSKEFQKTKLQTKQHRLNFTSSNTEYYNKPFTLDELVQSRNHMILPQALTKFTISC